LSVNLNALRLVEELCERADYYRVEVRRHPSGAKVIDSGIEAKGGLLAGRLITEIALGGLGEVKITTKSYGGSLELPLISITTDHPAIATLGSQLAGWRVKVGGYTAVGSGPARALALKPKPIYRKIKYRDEADVAILILEASEEPPGEVFSYVSDLCGVKPGSLYLIIVPTSSAAGFVQVSGRVIEAGMHKLARLGLNPLSVIYAHGYAPIMPPHPDYVEAMGRVNDAILYGGVAYYAVTGYKDEVLSDIANHSVSSVSGQYGRPFKEIFRDAGLNFYKVDPELFAPAEVTIYNVDTGRIFRAGGVNPKLLERSLGL